MIAHVAQDGTLEIQFFVETGRGYRPAQWPGGKALQEDNRIYLDAMFSPIRKVMFNVEKTRVGKEIDYDKLTLQLFTNGAENPVDVVHYAVSVLRTQLQHFLSSSEVPFNELSVVSMGEQAAGTAVATTPADALRGVAVDLFLKPIDELELSVRAHNCLVNAGIKRVIDLVNLSEEEGLKIKNFGRKSLNEVKESMKAFGLSFGMNIKESDIEKMVKESE